MICPYCNSSEVIHDYVHGYLVCSTCGAVLDQIFLEFYEEIPASIDHDVPSGLPNVREGIEKKKVKNKLRIYSKMSFEIIVYEKYAKKARKNVVVDLDTALKKEMKMTTKSRVYRHRDEDRVLSIAEKEPVVRMILENVINKDPVLSSRTPRGKIALALIIKNFIENHNIDLHNLCRETSMSLVHIRRLIALVKKRMPYIMNYISEVKKRITLNSKHVSVDNFNSILKSA